MRDPNRIDPILARLRAAWIASPDLRLGQLLACSLAIGGAEDKFARLFNAECPEFGAVNAPIEWPSVDRPAPTPTPAPGIDLDAMERAERAMTPGDWFVEKKPRFGGAISVLVDGLPRQVAEANGQALVVDEDPAARQIANAAGIVALRNAAPALIAEVRALRRHYDAAGPDRNLLALLDLYHEREQAALAKLAETTSLLRSAGDLFVEIQATDGEDEHKAITDGAKLSAAIAAALEAL